MNVFLCTGKLTRDVELKPVGESQVGTFGLAYSEKFKKRDGSWETRTSFFDCEIWGKPAESLAKHITKGKSVMIQANAVQETWDDKNTGTKRSKIKFKVDKWWFPPLPPKNKDVDSGDEDGDNDSSNTGGDEGTPF